mmetsp:Transcript_15908/g.34494  ORF Transcript_15908/g.34494 Transcript_15908/m.34494 type:complete len:341 (-) Transcript_15908:164-1186(-)|eukprot:CAMPEP_0118947358 /NCGR_PEP_ID=MMETSP1169-20130426/45846_1 /TAXON_ID=36882 /ORGANISM="Pyramimonas obovata, Strain CCMP722" /LENGTH=340 /DNA_ID=CAMNT_0006893555 /DNA_START=260 /DNA_END=1282 /DNA_ORIENTATION=+
MSNCVAPSENNWGIPTSVEGSVPIRLVCDKDYSIEGRRCTGAGSNASPRRERLSGAGLLAGAEELSMSCSPKLRRVSRANRFSDVINSFRDLPKEKACDWIAGYLPALNRDLQLDLMEHSNNIQRKILDYGCGKGAVASYLVQHMGVSCVLGCDISEKCLQEARERTKCLQQCLAFELIDKSGESKLPSNTYDGAMCNFVISVLPNKAEQLKILLNVKAALIPGAPFVVLVNNPNSTGTKFASIQVGEQGTKYKAGDLLRVQIFDMDTRQMYFESRDRWWPVEHYVELFTEAGFEDVRAEQRTASLEQHELLSSIGLDPREFQVESAVAPILAIRGIKPR